MTVHETRAFHQERVICFAHIDSIVHFMLHKHLTRSIFHITFVQTLMQCCMQELMLAACSSNCSAALAAPQPGEKERLRPTGA